MTFHEFNADTVLQFKQPNIKQQIANLFFQVDQYINITKSLVWETSVKKSAWKKQMTINEKNNKPNGSPLYTSVSEKPVNCRHTYVCLMKASSQQCAP